MGTAGGQNVIAVGSETPGIIHLYEWTDDVTQPFFQSVYSGVEDVHKTWKELYDERRTGDLGLKINEYVNILTI